MSKLRCHISISLDGFVAGPNQSEENPLGAGGERLHDWVIPLAALAERVLLALVRAGDETVQRDRDMTPQLAHRAPQLAGRFGRRLAMPLYDRSMPGNQSRLILSGADDHRVSHEPCPRNRRRGAE